jgi:hypothetical protein
MTVEALPVNQPETFTPAPCGTPRSATCPRWPTSPRTGWLDDQPVDLTPSGLATLFESARPDAPRRTAVANRRTTQRPPLTLGPDYHVLSRQVIVPAPEES